MKELQKDTELLRLKEFEEEVNFIDSLLRKEFRIIGIEYNKHKLKYYVCMRISNDKIEICLRNMHDRIPYPRCYAEIYRGVNNEKVCRLNDIMAEEKRVGNGSILLGYLINYAKSRRVWEMKGGLSFVDKEDFGVLEKFYEAHQFIVGFNDKRTSGWIKREL